MSIISGDMDKDAGEGSKGFDPAELCQCIYEPTEKCESENGVLSPEVLFETRNTQHNAKQKSVERPSDGKRRKAPGTDLTYVVASLPTSAVEPAKNRVSASVSKRGNTEERVNANTRPGRKCKKSSSDYRDTPQWILYHTIRDFRDGSGNYLSKPFWRLPARSNRGYFSKMQRPMSLAKIKTKLWDGKYKSTKRMITDMRIMFENARKMSDPDSELYKLSDRLQAVMQIKAKELNREQSKAHKSILNGIRERIASAHVKKFPTLQRLLTEEEGKKVNGPMETPSAPVERAKEQPVANTGVPQIAGWPRGLTNGSIILLTAPTGIQSIGQPGCQIYQNQIFVPVQQTVAQTNQVPIESTGNGVSDVRLVTNETCGAPTNSISAGQHACTKQASESSQGCEMISMEIDPVNQSSQNALLTQQSIPQIKQEPIDDTEVEALDVRLANDDLSHLDNHPEEMANESSRRASTSTESTGYDCQSLQVVQPILQEMLQIKQEPNEDTNIEVEDVRPVAKDSVEFNNWSAGVNNEHHTVPTNTISASQNTANALSPSYILHTSESSQGCEVISLDTGASCGSQSFQQIRPKIIPESCDLPIQIKQEPCEDMDEVLDVRITKAGLNSVAACSRAVTSVHRGTPTNTQSPEQYASTTQVSETSQRFETFPVGTNGPPSYQSFQNALPVQRNMPQIKREPCENTDNEMPDVSICFESMQDVDECSEGVTSENGSGPTNIQSAQQYFFESLQDDLPRPQAKKKADDTGDEVRHVRALIQELLEDIFLATYNHPKAKNCFCETLVPLSQTHVHAIKPTNKILYLEMVKEHLDMGGYRRLDHFQEDMFDVFQHIRSCSHPKDQIFKDSVDLHSFFIKQRDALCRNGTLLQSPALQYTEADLQTDVKSVTEQKLLSNPKGNKETECSISISVTSQTEVHAGDFVYIKPRAPGMEPHIVHVAKLWRDDLGEKWFNGTWFYRPKETYHLHDKKFMVKEVLQTDNLSYVPMDQILGKCYVMPFYDYCTMKPKEFEFKHVYFAKAKYWTKLSFSLDLKKWEFLPNHLVHFVPREKPLNPSCIPKCFEPLSSKTRQEFRETDVMKPRPEETSRKLQRYFYPEGVPLQKDIYYIGDFILFQPRNKGNESYIMEIEKIWRDHLGEKWLSGCWYYRPSQTYHPVMKTFLEKEVFKVYDTSNHIPLSQVLKKCYVMHSSQYFTKRPRELEFEDVYVCKMKYGTQAKQFFKIKTWTHTTNYPLQLVQREEKFDPVRIPSIFKSESEPTHSSNERALDSVNRRPNSICKVRNPEEGATYYEQYTTSRGTYKLGDFGYVHKEFFKVSIVRIEKMWVDKKGEMFCQGPLFVTVAQVYGHGAKSPLFRKVLLISLAVKYPLFHIVGRCVVMECRDFCVKRLTEVNEKDVFIRETQHLQAQQIIIPSQGLSVIPVGPNVTEDEYYYLRKPITNESLRKTYMAIGGPESNPEKKFQPSSPVEEVYRGVLTGYYLFMRDARRRLIGYDCDRSLIDMNNYIEKQWNKLHPDMQKIFEDEAKKQSRVAQAKCVPDFEPPSTGSSIASIPTDHHIYSCLWDRCDLHFKNQIDLFNHLLTLDGHIQQTYHYTIDAVTEYHCLWANCQRANQKLTPFLSILQLISHVEELHLKN